MDFSIIIFFGAVILLAMIGLICLIWHQMKDKAYREAHGLPRKKYHNIVDMDITDTWEHNSRQRK